MAEEIGALRAVLALESAAFDKGVASARRQLGALDGSFQRTGAQVGQFGQRMSRDATGGFRSLERSSNAARGGLQNFGYQVQDFAVQVAGGTSATRALSQQLPQLLSGFGLLGIVLGTTAAIAIPVASALFNIGESSAAAAERIKTLEGAISELKKINTNFDLSGVDVLITKYGELDAAVVLMLNRQREAKEQAVIESAKAAASSLGGEIEQINVILEAYDNFTKAALTDQGWAINAAAEAEALQFQFGLTTEGARDLIATLSDFRGVDGLEQTATAASGLIGKLEGSTLASDSLIDSLLAVEDAARQGANEMAGMSGFLGSAIDMASGLASKLWEAAGAAAAVRNASVDVPGGDGQIASAYGLYARTRSLAPELPIANAPTGATRPQQRPMDLGISSSRAGGGGAAQKEANELQREAARVFANTRTESEKYAAEVGKLNNLVSSGAVTQDTFNRKRHATPLCGDA